MINTENWTRFIPNESMPQKNERVLISDGEHIVIARLIEDSETNLIWIFDNPTHKCMDVVWYQTLPDNPPIVQQSHNE